MKNSFGLMLLVMLTGINLAVGQTSGNPENWCRNGAFPADESGFRVAKVTGKSGAKLKLRNDFEDDCPTSPKCVSKETVLSGDEVVVSREYKGFACVYLPNGGGGTAGWLETGRLEYLPEPIRYEWIGTWEFWNDSLTIKKLPEGRLQVAGSAFWIGSPTNVHTGEISAAGNPSDNVLLLSEGDDEFACKMKLTRVGRYLIASDNGNCGGMNVRFDGVYRRGKTAPVRKKP